MQFTMKNGSRVNNFHQEYIHLSKWHVDRSSNGDEEYQEATPAI